MKKLYVLMFLVLLAVGCADLPPEPGEFTAPFGKAVEIYEGYAPPNDVFDNYRLWSHDIMRRFLGIILSLPPAKQILASRQLRSKYLKKFTKLKWYDIFNKIYYDGQGQDYSHPELKK